MGGVLGNLGRILFFLSLVLVEVCGFLSYIELRSLYVGELSFYVFF